MSEPNLPSDTSATGDARQQGLRIALALSGGGIRAMLFHLGVLRCLAERQLLENVRYISTVSGGTLVVGLLLSLNDYQWPSSAKFLPALHNRVLERIIGKDLQLRALARLLFLPWNWRYLPFRANVLSTCIARDWGVDAPVSALPKSPQWAINATNVETGVRWRFRTEVADPSRLGGFGMGDREVGYTYDDSYPLANAMATSAAFPGGISPLVFRASRRVWYRTQFEDQAQAPLQVSPLFRSYHLADGGVYDNLGLEPIFDASARRLRTATGCNFIISADAGAPLRTTRWGPISQLLAFTMRTVNIMSGQQRALRVRGLVGAIVAGDIDGIFINIGQPARTSVAQALKQGVAGAAELQDVQWLSESEAERAALYKTTLRTPPSEMRELIERHGYEITRAQATLYGGPRLQQL